MADYLNYVLSNPDLRENAEALGLTQAEMKEWGKTHWDNHGSKEGADGQGRRNSPTETVWESGYTETLGAQHYQGRDPNEVLQRSVRSFYQGADADDYNMWEAREGIDDAWNLGKYSSSGWNMAADNPYKTGILGNTIEVNEGLGQLVPTEAGNQRFIQDRYIDTALANDFVPGWVENNVWKGPENLGGYWDDLTNATRDSSGNLWRATDYDPNTALRPSTNVGNRGLGGGVGGGVGGGLLGNMYEAAYTPRGLLDWSAYQTDPSFVLQENNMANYQPWAAGQGALPVYGSSGGGYGGGTGATTGGGGYTSVFNTGNNTTGTGNTMTDAQGNKWIMSNGQWIPTTSDLGSILAAGNTSRHPLGHYDSNGMWVGAEGPQGDGTNSPGFSQAEIATGIAVDYGGKWGDRQMGLNMLGNMGMFGNAFGAAKSGTGFGGDIEVGYNDPDIEHSGVTGAGSGGWTQRTKLWLVAEQQ